MGAKHIVTQSCIMLIVPMNSILDWANAIDILAKSIIYDKQKNAVPIRYDSLCLCVDNCALLSSFARLKMQDWLHFWLAC